MGRVSHDDLSLFRKTINRKGLISMPNEHPPLTAYSEDQRQKAMDKYRLIDPYLNNEKSLKAIA